MRRQFYQKVIIVIIIILFGSNLGQDVINNQVNLRSTASIISNSGWGKFTIDIVGNSQLASYASNGDGSVTNPYLIENLKIDNNNSEENGVSIRDTDVSFILRNVTVISFNIGFRFQEVRYGRIEKSFATNCNVGFSLFACFYTTLNENTANRNREGFATYNVVNSSLTNNTACNNLEKGFFLARSWRNNITRNSANDNNGSGYTIYESRSNNFSENIANNNRNGFYLYGHSRYNLFIVNTATNSTLSDYSEDESSLNENTLINNVFPSYSMSANTPSFLYISVINIISILTFLRRKRRKRNN
ncbi:MAG: right-handed parallel beta-helix repeat-containing protein [Candidatus Hodarchaeales archaeon]|jgi:parallel beta-helix repeat protein